MLWSRYKKLAWVGFKPTNNEFRSDALSDWATRSWVDTHNSHSHTQSQLWTATPIWPFVHLFSVKFYFGYCLHQSPPCLFEWKFPWGNYISVAEGTYFKMSRRIWKRECVFNMTTLSISIIYVCVYIYIYIYIYN